MSDEHNREDSGIRPQPPVGKEPIPTDPDALKDDLVELRRGDTDAVNFHLLGCEALSKAVHQQAQDHGPEAPLPLGQMLGMAQQALIQMNEALKEEKWGEAKEPAAELFLTMLVVGAILDHELGDVEGGEKDGIRSWSGLVSSYFDA